MPFAIEKRTYLNKNTMSEAHYHSHYEMLYVMENERYLVANERKYILNKGTIALIAPYTPHRTIAGERSPETRILINFTESFVHRVLEGIGVDCLSVFNPANPIVTLGCESERVRSIFEMMLGISACEDEPYKDERCAMLLSEVLLGLRGVVGEAERERTLFDATKYIEMHFAEHITLDTLAKRFFMSKYTFLRKFKTHTGVGLPAYVNTIRIINAKRMLSDGCGITECAMACGFESLSNFDRVFRKETGLSPREYIKILQTK